MAHSAGMSGEPLHAIFDNRADIWESWFMKFTVLSHAGLHVEHNGVHIVCDPWLIGSCYWRSWWNFPEPPAALIGNLQPDYIYITHLHWDHFHGVSLRKLFAPTTRILVPKVPTRRMLRDLAYLGFHNVTEIPHGTELRLGDDFTLRSYQFGLGVDSAIVLDGGGFTLFNCNDCKFFGLPLRQITGRFPKVDFVLRSYSSASAIPYCIQEYEETYSHLRSQQDYIEEFSRFALSIGARHAIPFASNHCFLHKDTWQFNRTAVLAEDVRRHYTQLAAQINRKSECVVMPPGSSWSDVDGFQILPFDYANADVYLQDLRARHEATLHRQYQRETQTLADFEGFREYFTGFLRSLPSLVRKWLKLRIVFRTRDADGEHNWLVDLVAGRIEAGMEVGDDCVVLETPALVLNDCTKNHMFSVWTASKRLKIHLPSPSHLKSVKAFFSLLDFYELETIPLRRNLSWRALGVRMRRWRDVVEAGHLVLKHFLLGRPFDIASLYHLPMCVHAKTQANGDSQGS